MNRRNSRQSRGPHPQDAAQLPDAPREADPLPELTPARIRRLVGHHLGDLQIALFRDLTGLNLHVLWHDGQDHLTADGVLIPCPEARAVAGIGQRPDSSCARCLSERWSAGEIPMRRSRVLQGACGATCAWIGLRVGTLSPVSLVLRTDSPSPQFAQAVQLQEQYFREVSVALAAAVARHRLTCVLRRQRSPTVDTPTPEPADAAEPHDQPSRAPAVQAMLDFLHANYHRSLVLADVAAALKMNPSYLSVIFSRAMGLGFHCYLQQLRLAKARELLRDPALHVCEVAAAAGFSSANHFNNVFKTAIGQTPSEWRSRTGASPDRG